MVESQSFMHGIAARRPARARGRVLAVLTLALATGCLVTAPAQASLLPEIGLARQERLAQAGPAAGEIVLADRWNAYQGDGGWYVRGGEKEFVPMPNEKVANRTAKQFNRIEKRAAKRADGFVPADTGPCADPSSGVLC